MADTRNAEVFLAYQKGRELLSRRLHDQAAVELRRAFQLDTNHTRAWNILAQSEWAPLIYGGTTNEVATTYKRLSSEAAIHAKSGAPEEARKILRELEAQAEKGMHIPYAWIAWSYGMLGDFDSARRWLRTELLEGHGDWSMITLRSAEKLEILGKLPWYWEIVDGMKFPPLQMDHPFFALEQAMRYGRGTVGQTTTSASGEGG